MSEERSDEWSGKLCRWAVYARSVRQMERSGDCRLNDMMMTFGDIYCCRFAPAVATQGRRALFE